MHIRKASRSRFFDPRAPLALCSASSQDKNQTQCDELLQGAQCVRLLMVAGGVQLSRLLPAPTYIRAEGDTPSAHGNRMVLTGTSRAGPRKR